MVSERLIEEVRKRPNLYDKTRPDYMIRTKTTSAWLEIGEAIGCSGEEAQKRWNNIRDAFRKSQQETKRKVSGQEAKSTKEYVYGPLLGFLLPQFTERESRTSTLARKEPESRMDATDATEVDVNADENVETVSDDATKHASSESIVQTTEPPTKLLRKRSSNAVDHKRSQQERAESRVQLLQQLDTVHQRLADIVDKPRSRHEGFAAEVMQSLDEMSPHRAQVAKSEIFQVLAKHHELEFKNYGLGDLQLPSIYSCEAFSDIS